MVQFWLWEKKGNYYNKNNNNNNNNNKKKNVKCKSGPKSVCEWFKLLVSLWLLVKWVKGHQGMNECRNV